MTLLSKIKQNIQDDQDEIICDVDDNNDSDVKVTVFRN